MKFFIPKVLDDEKAEEIYQGIKALAVGEIGGEISDQRVFRITYSVGKQYQSAEVDQPEPITGERVIAILEHAEMYLVCTRSKGVVRGIPLLVGKYEVKAITLFDE